MQYSQRMFLSDDALPKDEIDELFEKLQPIEPTPLLIQHILTSISHLAHPAPPKLWDADALDSLVVRNEHHPPS